MLVTLVTSKSIFFKDLDDAFQLARRFKDKAVRLELDQLGRRLGRVYQVRHRYEIAIQLQMLFSILES